MSEIFKLSIEKPCSQSFNNFKQTDSGGFCNSCKKDVIDFTQMNDLEINNYFQNQEKNICGRFNKQQLKTYKHKTNTYRKNSSIGLGLASFSLLSLLSINESKAQNKEESSVIQNIRATSNSNSNSKKENQLITISGVVTGIGLPLPGVNVYVKETNIGAITDFDGIFKITAKLKPGDTLIFSSLGFKTLEYVLPENLSNNFNLNLEEDFMLTEDICVLGEVNVKKTYSSRKPFWQKIKNWF